jgi:hypothetical protein
MKTLTLIAAIAATTITAVSAEEPNPLPAERSEREYYMINGGKKQHDRNTVDIRIRHGERRRLESTVMTGEFATLSDRVQLRLEAKFGGPAEALKRADAIKYDCYFHATEFCRKYNKSDSATWAYEMQEYVTTGMQEKAIKIANRSNTLANTLAKN